MNNKPFVSDIRSVLRSSTSFLFDFDGVLADSEPFFRKSWNTALKPWGHSISEEDYWKYWSSLGEGLLGEIRRHGLSGIDIPRVKKRQKYFYERFVSDNMIPLFPEAKKLLEILSSNNNYPKHSFCIASNTSITLIRHILIAAAVPVPVIVGGDDLKRKPSPDIFLRASSILRCNPSSAIVFEDSWKGITAAKSGGFISVLVLNSYNRNLKIESDFVIDGIASLIDILN